MKVLAGGRFNIIHPGHVYFLRKAGALGDCLVVVVASDRTVKNEKKRLLFPEKDRKAMVESLKCVDKAVVGYDISSESGYIKLIQKERPDIIALGYDQRVSGAHLKALAQRVGVNCRIVRITRLPGYKTSSIVKSFATETVSCQHSRKRALHSLHRTSCSG